MKKTYLTWADVENRLLKHLDELEDEVICGVPRGGMLACWSIIDFIGDSGELCFASKPEDASVVIDDIIDSGRTKERWLKKYPHHKFIAVVDKTTEEDKDLGWVVFPWEKDKESDYDETITRVLEHNNLDVNSKNIEVVKSVINNLKIGE